MATLNVDKSMTVKLPVIGSWSRPSVHCFDSTQLDAIEAAELSGRPLLVRGEPGLGKSQIARAVAAKKEWRLVTAVINARTEVEDLLCRIDHVRRLGDAHRMVQASTSSPASGAGSSESGFNEQADSVPLSSYLIEGAIWHALKDIPESAFQDRPEQGVGHYNCKQGCVLLIDEIDKAHPDIPNALLEVLDAGSFQVPATKEVVKGDLNKLFVVITANDERGLPSAFLRRCVVLDLVLPSDPREKLTEYANAHKNAGLIKHVSEQVFAEAASVVYKYRDTLSPGDYRPGTSEYLDLLRVIDRKIEEGSIGPEEISATIERMSHYLIRKSMVADYTV